MESIDPQQAEKREYEQFLKLLGAHIRALRKERGWTLRDMVIQHGFHLSAWQGYEAGRFGMSLPSLLRVSRALGMHPANLLKDVPFDVPGLATIESVPADKTVRKRIGAARRE